MTGGPPPLLLQLAVSLSQPPRPALGPGEDPLGIEPVQRIIGVLGGLVVFLCLRLDLLLLLERTRQPLPTSAIASAMICRAIRS